MSIASVFTILMLVAGPQAMTPVSDARVEYSPHSAAPTGCRADTTFLGFSRNLRAFALETHVDCARPPHQHDTYSVIDLVQLAPMRLVATFKGQSIERHNGSGRYHFVAAATLARDNAFFTRALSHKAWLRADTLGRFCAVRHDFDDVLLRLRLDDDAPAHAHINGLTLHVDGQANKALGFAPILRMDDGTDVGVGHFRLEANAIRHAASLMLSYTSDGHHIALINQFDGGKKTDVAIVTLPEALLLGSSELGSAVYLERNADAVKDLFVDSHPEAKTLWEENVGALQ